MVSLLLSSLIILTSPFDDEAVALAKARAFRNIAASANGTYSNQYEPEFDLVSTEHDSTQYVFNFKDGRVRLRRSDHLIIGFSFSPADAKWPPPDTWDSENEIGDSVARALADQYIASSGWPQPCALKSLQKDVYIVCMAYIMSLAPRYDNVIYHPDDRILIVVEYNTGRLLLLSRSAELPNPPGSLQVSVSMETALYSFAAYVYSHYGVSYLNADLAELIIWNPKKEHVYPNEDNLPQSVRDLIGTNDATLAYMIAALQPSMGEIVKPDIALFEGYVDPVTGAVWSVIRLSPFGGGGKPGLMRWDLGVGAITVSNGKQSIEVKDADVDQALAPKKFTPSSKLVLRRAKVVAVIEYDRASGLIRTSLDGSHSYGKPSGNLKKALDQLTR